MQHPISRELVYRPPSPHLYHRRGAQRPLPRPVRGIATPKWMIAAIFVTAYYASLRFLELYDLGDQVWYTQLYNILEFTPFLDVPLVQREHVGGAEFLYGYVMWVGSHVGFQKGVYIALFNAVLICLLFVFLKMNRAGLAVTSLALSNYYLLVLITSAERLKFAYLVLLIAAVATARWKRVLALALAPAFHFQTLLFYGGLLAPQALNLLISNPRMRARALMVIGGAIIGGLIVSAIFSEAILHKLWYYTAHRPDGGILELADIAVLSIVGLMVARDKLRIASAMSPMIIAVGIFGGERINMIGFTLMFYFLVDERRVHHPLFILILCYFSYKSIGYIDNVLTYGTGFSEY